MADLPKLAIRTSDRGAFRKCRTRWDFSSKLRQGFNYTPGIDALDFGIAMHVAWEVMYDPETWHWRSDPVKRKAWTGLVLGAFDEELERQKKRIRDNGQWHDGQEAKFKEFRKLGRGMLKHYMAASREFDRHITPVKVELEFEVPIPVPDDLIDQMVPLAKRFLVGPSDHNLYCLMDGTWYQVVYQGRLDALVEYDNRLWIMDHKTAAQFREDMSFLERDQQIGSYAWALREIGIDVAGVIYSQARKSVPHPPRVLKNGTLSVAKNQATTAFLFRQKLAELGQSEEGYKDYLQYLENRDSEYAYFRRFVIHKSPTELDILGRNIVLESIDMLGNPAIYPNPDQFNCSGCPYKAPCLAKQDGSDVEWLLNESGLYTKESY